MLTAEEMEEARRVLPAIATLPSRLRLELSRQGRFLEFHGGQTLFDEGHVCLGLLLVTRGRARVSKRSPDGRNLLLYELTPGEFCALTVQSILGRTVLAAQGEAVEDGEGILIPGDLFEKLIVSAPDFREATFKMLGRRLAEALLLVEQVAVGRLDSRLAGLLLRYAGKSRGAVPASHQQLAEDLDCSRQLVSRLLLSLQDQGLVVLGRKRIEIRNRQALSDLAALERPR